MTASRTANWARRLARPCFLFYNLYDGAAAQDNAVFIVCHRRLPGRHRPLGLGEGEPHPVPLRDNGGGLLLSLIHI